MKVNIENQDVFETAADDELFAVVVDFKGRKAFRESSRDVVSRYVTQSDPTVTNKTPAELEACALGMYEKLTLEFHTIMQEYVVTAAVLARKAIGVASQALGEDFLVPEFDEETFSLIIPVVKKNAPRALKEITQIEDIENIFIQTNFSPERAKYQGQIKYIYTSHDLPCRDSSEYESSDPDSPDSIGSVRPHQWIHVDMLVDRARFSALLSARITQNKL